MKIYGFTGYGNYSPTFGWDKGISCTLENEYTQEEYNREKDSVENNEYFHYPSLDEMYNNEVYIVLFNEFGGNRRVEGFVCTDNKENALTALKSYEDNLNEIIQKDE